MDHVPDFQTSCYSLHTQESLAIIHFFGDIYELGTGLGLKDDFFPPPIHKQFPQNQGTSSFKFTWCVWRREFLPLHLKCHRSTVGM